MAETLDINRERRALKVLERLDKRRSEGKFDFTIIIGTQKILAEQNVLASGSDYFEAMFSHDTKERRNREVEMLGVDFESVKTCIGFIYGKEVKFSIEKSGKLMFVARMMQLEELCDAIEEKLIKQLTLKTFFNIRSLALTFSCFKLIDVCKRFAEDSFHSLCMDENFNTLEMAFIIEMLKSKIIRVEEEDKLKMAVEWVKHDTERRTDLLELLKCLDFSKISKEVGQSYIRDEPIINANPECLFYFSLSIIESMPSQSKKTKILIFEENSQNLQMYVPDDNSIRNLPFSKPNHPYYSVVSLHDYVYCLCEDKSVHRLQYSDLGATWQRMKDMVEEHGRRPPAAILSGHIYVIGGYKNCCTTAVERYDHQKNEWHLLESLSHKIQYAGILALGENIYSFGGCVNSQYVNNVARLHTMTSEWETLSSMNERKGFVSATNYRFMIYVAGGFNGSHVLNTFESYDPSTNQWAVLPRMINNRIYFKLFSIDGIMYAVGGHRSRLSTDSIEKYDIENREWKKIEIEEILDVASSVAINA